MVLLTGVFETEKLNERCPLVCEWPSETSRQVKFREASSACSYLTCLRKSSLSCWPTTRGFKWALQDCAVQLRLPFPPGAPGGNRCCAQVFSFSRTQTLWSRRGREPGSLGRCEGPSHVSCNNWITGLASSTGTERDLLERWLGMWSGC